MLRGWLCRLGTESSSETRECHGHPPLLAAAISRAAEVCLPMSQVEALEMQV